MPRKPSDVRKRILDTVEKQLRRPSGENLTFDGIAAEAGCAKGLINYHFTSKGELLAAAAENLLRDRAQRWRSALEATSPEATIRQTWQLINQEVDGGLWKAIISLSSSNDKLTIRTVNSGMEAFGGVISESVTRLLQSLELVSTISTAEMGHLIAAAVQGFGMQLSNGMSADHVEGAHDALWLGLLALTKPRP